MKVLVTGATGFLGKHIIKRMIDEGHTVYAVGRNKKIGEEIKKLGAVFICTDLSNEDEVMQFPNVDYVIHSAAKSSPWGKYEDFYSANVTSTKNLISYAKKNMNKRFIYVSTPSIYFNYQDKYDIKETEQLPNKFVNYYASTKHMAERMVLDSELKETIAIRPRALFGPGDTSIIPRLIEANKKIGIPVIGNKNPLIDITYVDNVVEAIVCCMTSKKETLKKAYNITNGEPMYLQEILKRLFDEINVPIKQKHVTLFSVKCLCFSMELFYKCFLPKKEPLLTMYSASVLCTSQTLDISSAMSELGYKPKVSINQGIQLFVDSIKEELE